ncbi:hypothetical protein J2W22_000268 [Sphingomonas kyeonggiensis]|nr:hypothetical protein [Sphingomonas kyeonggiensis]
MAFPHQPLFTATFAPFLVIPAQAGIQGNRAMTFVALDPRLRGDDDQNRKAGQSC